MTSTATGRRLTLKKHPPMNSEEYANMERVEGGHWYYAGKREFVREWILRTRRPAATDVLLDCGAGTGRFAKEMEAYCRVLVLDDHEEALRLLRAKFAAEQVLALGKEGVPQPDASVDYVTALDVLEHVPDDVVVVSGFHRLLKPGGLAVVTVPASMALWSDWDVALHHHRRYDRVQLRTLFPERDWEVVQVNYTNVPVYPLVWLVRRWRRWFPAQAERDRAEDKMPARWVNALLRWQFTRLASLRVPMPFGVSLLLVARRL
jgi:SAM-dependent methyltransferase